MRRLALSALAVAAVASPASALAAPDRRLIFEDNVGPGKSTSIEITTQKRASFRVVLRVPRGPRAARSQRVVALEVRDVAPGLWIWRAAHPDWQPGLDWESTVTSTCVESGGEVAVLDALAPTDGAEALWERLDARPPTLAVVLKPDHVRSVDLFVRRYGARAFGPWLFWPDDVPETRLKGVDPGTELLGGLVALYDGRGRNETPLWLPEQRALVFADALTAPGGELRVWATPWHEERVLPALRALLELPFEHVIVSHGEPVHDRAAYEHALASDAWRGG